MSNTGNGNLGWSNDVWNQIKNAVQTEAAQTKVAAQFLPLCLCGADAMTVPAERVDEETMTVDPTAVTPLVEIWSPFSMTDQQVQKEQSLHTAVSLATRATNLLSQAEDLLVFQGRDVVDTDRFRKLNIRYRGSVDRFKEIVGRGLLKAASESVTVKAVDADKYGQNTVTAVSEAKSNLTENAQNGPFALVLPTGPYADAYAPLKDTLATPADSIKALIASATDGGQTVARFFGTGALPTNVDAETASTGVLVSLGGNTMDLVVANAPTVEYTGYDRDQAEHCFRVFETFAFRPKVDTAIVTLAFAKKAQMEAPQEAERAKSAKQS